MNNILNYRRKIYGLKSLVGKTPLLRIIYKFKGEKRDFFAKAEYLNYTGSIKDRMAYHILSDAYNSGELKPGMKIAEATSGNTGIAVVALGRYLGHEVTIFMPDWMSKERINLIKSFGANIELISREDGGFLRSIALANEMKENDPDNVFLPLQFDNEMNCKAHFLSTGPEIYDQMSLTGVIPNAFIAGVGTGGTIMGAGKFLREVFPGIKVCPLEPLSSPTLTTGHQVGKHRIQGISDEFIPSIVKLDELDEIVAVDDGDSIIMAQKIARTFGLGVGISSGANLLGAVHLQNKYGKDLDVVTIFADDNKKYLTTDYAKTEPVKPEFLSNHIELLDLSVISR